MNRKDLPRRLLVSPVGTAHMPTCRSVPVTAESRSWGELANVEFSLAALNEGRQVTSTRRGVLPGPEARRTCACVSAATNLQRGAATS